MSWDYYVVVKYLPFLLAGLRMTFAVTIASAAVGLVLGLIVALPRLAHSKFLRFIAGLYIDLLRSTPPLAQLVWVFYALPILTGYSLEPFVAGVLMLGANASANLAEIYRAGILSIPRGQKQAALALGMTPWQAMGRIVLPQAITRMLPPIGSQFISLFKDSALVSLITLREFMYQAQSLAAFTLRPVEVLTAAAVVYSLLTLPQAMLVNHLHRRYLAH